jgi:hypothetical protein
MTGQSALESAGRGLPVGEGELDGGPPSTSLVGSYALGLLSMLLGLALRLAYAIHASPYIDEFTTAWAAQQVLAHGLPRFPSGAIYTQGLIYTYLDAIALVLGDAFTPLLARLPSLILSTVTLALTIYAARRLFRTLPVGLAAFWLALDAQAILWGGRARTYALLQLLILAAFLAWYHGAVAGDRPRSRWLAIGLLLAALLDQPLILLLLPPLAVLAVAARGLAWLRRPVVWFQAGVIVLAAAGRWLLYGLMIPAGTTVTAEPRAFVDLAQPLAGWQSLATFYTDPNRLLPTLLLAGGVVWLVLRTRSGAPAWGRPVLSLASLLFLVGLEMLLVVGTTWREARYLYPLLPLLFLGAEGVAVPVMRGLARHLPRPAGRWALIGLTAVLVVLSAWLAYPDVRAVATRDEWGYDQAMAFVGERWTQGDGLATIAPAAAFVVLDRADYLAIEEGAQALVVAGDDGRPVDGWTGLPLLDSPARLAEALEAYPHLWFVADEMRLNRHFSSDYLRLLWERADLEAFERGTFVFRSRPAGALPAVDRVREDDLAGQLRLEGYALSDDRPEPGDTVTVTLRWAPLAPQGDYTAFVHLVNRAGEGVTGHDAPPLGGLYPVDRWPRSPRSWPFPDRHPLSLPADLPPGRYRLEVGLYRPGTLEPVGERVTLDFLSVAEEAVEPPAGPAIARFGDVAVLYLLGLEGDLEPGGAAHLDLAWHTGPAGFDADYTIFLHLLDGEGGIAQQWDARPAGGWYPTSFWQPGEVVVDGHELAFSPMLSPGTYRLIAGLYRADGTRLPLDDGSDSVELAIVELEP